MPRRGLRDCPRWTPSEPIARALRRSLSAPPTVKCPDPQPSCTRLMDAVIICRPSLPKFGAIAANSTFGTSSRHVQVPTKRLPSSPPRLLCRSPGPGPSAASLSRPKPHLSWVMKLTLAHTTALQPHTRPFQPQTPPARTPTSHTLKHNPIKAHPCSEWARATTW